MNDVIQINPEFRGDRVATYLLVQQLTQQRERIKAEMDRITLSLNDQIDTVVTPDERNVLLRDLQKSYAKLDSELKAALEQAPPLEAPPDAFCS